MSDRQLRIESSQCSVGVFWGVFVCFLIKVAKIENIYPVLNVSLLCCFFSSIFRTDQINYSCVFIPHIHPVKFLAR